MGSSARTGWMTLALASALVLTGCTAPPPHTVAVSSPTATPVFASDEEALAAAVEAYEKYLKVLDLAFETASPDGIETAASGPALEAAQNSVAEMKALGQHGAGSTVARNVQLVSFGPGTIEKGLDREVQLYACLDVSETDILDAHGVSVVAESVDRQYPVIVLLISPDVSNALMVEREEIWDGESFCD